MQKDIRKRSVILFIIFLGFIALGFTGYYQGVNDHQLWRILAAAAGTFTFLALTVLLIRKVIRYDQEAADTFDPFR